MSKFCPIANAVTNCTDNCKSCLEEEKRSNELFGCEVVGYCPFDNEKEGFPCPNCPYEKYGGYIDHSDDDYRNIYFEEEE